MESRQATEQRRVERQVFLLSVWRTPRCAVQHDHGQALHGPVPRDRAAKW